MSVLERVPGCQVTGAAKAETAEAEQEVVAIVGSVEALNTLQENYAVLKWCVRRKDSEMVSKIAAAMEDGRLTAEQAYSLSRLVDQGERVLFMVSNGKVETSTPGGWVEDFSGLFEAITAQSHERWVGTMLKMCRLGYWTGFPD